VVPLDAANVDTDAIIPKQFLQKVTRTGLARTCLTTGVSWTIKAAAEPGIRAELPGVQRRIDPAGAGKLWLRLLP
jgi:hypothetical protein